MRAAEWRKYMESLVQNLSKPIFWSFAPHRKQEFDEIVERVKTAKNARERKLIEEDLDSLLERELDLRRPADWRGLMGALIEGTKGQLCASAPGKARRDLDEMLKRVNDAKNARQRGKAQEELEALIESAPYFRAAYKRSISERLSAALDEANRVVPLLLEQIRAAEKRK